MEQIVTKPQPSPPSEVAATLGTGRRRRRRWPYVALIVLAAAGAGSWYRYGQPEPPVRYAAQEVRRGPLTVQVTATGTLQPLTKVDVSSELSGVIRTVSVDENARVAKGQILAQLDTARITAQVERAQANVKAAQARVGDAKVTLLEAEQGLRRSEQLLGRGVVGEQALETARAARDRAASAVETAEANVAVAQADLRLSQADLGKSTIYAPIDGIVLTRSVNPGQTVASSMSAPVLFVIAERLETMQLNAAVDEADIGSIAKGQGARFTVDAFPGRTFDAAISDISYASATTEGVVTYQARLAVDNGDLALRPGMTATVNIVTRQSDNALAVPSTALRFAPPAQEAARSFSVRDLFMPRFGPQRPQRNRDTGRAVYVLEAGQPVRKPVEIGATVGDRTEITAGLAEGDRVITGIARSDGAGQRQGQREGQGLRQNRGGQGGGAEGPPPPPGG